jgi:hypothetical protein
MAVRVLSKKSFSASYFTPAVKPRFKPSMGGHITPFGISKPRVKPRILPTPVSGISGGGGSIPSVGGASPTALLKKTHTGVAAATKPKPPASTAPRSMQAQSASGTATKPKSTAPGSRPVPSGVIKAPRSIAAQRPGFHMTSKTQVKMKVNRRNPLKASHYGFPKPFKI